MVLLEDTRQKPGKHNRKAEWFRQNEIEVRRTKLYVGDYQIASNGARVVDTKEGIMELLSDFHQQHERFRAECIRAQEAGISLLILIEEWPPDGDILKWKSPVWKFGKKCGLRYTMAKMDVLKKAMDTMTEKYGVRFEFCKPEESGERIMRYLNEL